MKRYLILLFIFIQGLVFSATKTLSDIKTLKFDVVEKTNIKSKKREISYKIDFILPNKIKKEVTAPELNKGEIYIYDYFKLLISSFQMQFNNPIFSSTFPRITFLDIIFYIVLLFVA